MAPLQVHRIRRQSTHNMTKYFEMENITEGDQGYYLVALYRGIYDKVVEIRVVPSNEVSIHIAKWALYKCVEIVSAMGDFIVQVLFAIAVIFAKWVLCQYDFGQMVEVFAKWVVVIIFTKGLIGYGGGYKVVEHSVLMCPTGWPSPPM